MNIIDKMTILGYIFLVFGWGFVLMGNKFNKLSSGLFICALIVFLSNLIISFSQ